MKGCKSLQRFLLFPKPRGLPDHILRSKCVRNDYWG